MSKIQLPEVNENNGIVDYCYSTVDRSIRLENECFRLFLSIYHKYGVSCTGKSAETYKSQKWSKW